MNGRPRIIQSKEFLEYQEACGWYINNQGRKIDTPVNLRCIFYRKDNRVADLINYLEAIQDILVHYGVLKDDNWHIVVSTDGSRVRVDKNCPRTEIIITEVENEKTNSL